MASSTTLEGISAVIPHPACMEVADIGILLFNASPRLVYMDGQARSLCARINFNQTGLAANGVFPSDVMLLSQEIADAIQARGSTNDWTPFEIRRLAGNHQEPVLLRGFGLPQKNECGDGRILIVMEDVSSRKEVRSKQACERFRFTDRECAVVNHLSKGYTNKEIAGALGITEQGVKEVIKRIMYKTKTNTRTGILIKVLGV
jgi:DNA-binding CsgD family transcriptional regulator